MDDHVFTIYEREALRTGASEIRNLLGRMSLVHATYFDGLSVHELEDIAASLQTMANRRAEPEPEPAPAPRLDAFKNKVAEHELRLDALAERVATLEQVAGYGPRAGQGFREAGERGEPSEG